MLVADVALDARAGGSQAVFSYLADESTQPGQTYVAPLGTRELFGVVVAVRAPDEGEATDRLRPLGSRIEGLDLPMPLMQAVRFVAESYLSTLPVAVSLALPPGLRERLAIEWRLQSEPAPGDLTRLQREALELVRSQGSILLESRAKPVDTSMRRALRLLRAKGILSSSLRLVEAKERHRLSGSFRLTSDDAAIKGFLGSEGKNRPAQALTVMRLQDAAGCSFTAQEIKALCGVTDSVIRSLLASDLLLRDEAVTPVHAQLPKLSVDQAGALEPISKAIAARSHRAFLLYGVTGSGKTEVYLRAAAEALARGRQVLYIAPEIALTAQVVGQLKERFGSRVALMHSGMGPRERLDSWVRVKTGEAAIVLGARSALFAPAEAVGLIILDEEHEGSYKQEAAPRYHARAVAMLLAKAHRAALVLGSATPSAESWHAARLGELELLQMPARVAGASMPEVQIEDLGELYRDGKPAMFGPILTELLSEALSRDEQGILFLNRRAYAPFLMCRDCGHSFRCPRCSISLAFHRAARRLRCHHCGYQEGAPDKCPQCQGSRISPFGAGSEKVEEAVRHHFPLARTARLDRDVVRRKGALEEIISKFRAGETNVLVGTQLVAKGLHFPKVTVVGVVAADISLNIPDFRARERTFQLLSQVAGRAGRAEHPGRVVIQTFSPEDPSVLAASSHSYEPFMQGLLEERSEAGYPPYTTLINIIAASKSLDLAVRAAADVKARLAAAMPEAEVLGPADCPIERLNTFWRRHVIVKLPRHGFVGPIREALDGLGGSALQLTIDVDPYSFS